MKLKYIGKHGERPDKSCYLLRFQVASLKNRYPFLQPNNQVFTLNTIPIPFAPTTNYFDMHRVIGNAQASYIFASIAWKKKMQNKLNGTLWHLKIENFL